MSFNNPLRIMQVENFYPDSLEVLYTKNPELRYESVKIQERALIADGFSAIHILPPYLEHHGCIAELVVPNCGPLQMAWARENGREGLNDYYELVHARIEKFQPDILYFSDSITFSAPFLNALRFRPKIIMGWRGSDIPLSTDWTGYDIILSGLPKLLQAAHLFGAKTAEYFVPGVPAWIPEQLVDIPQDIDIVFVGGISASQHFRRQALLDIIAQAALREGFSLALHVSCPPEVITPAMEPFLCPPAFGMDMHKALCRGKIVFDVRGDMGLLAPDGTRYLDIAGDHTINMRLFEGTCGGSLVLTEALPGLSELFEPEKELATFTDSETLLQVIQYYLTHDEQRIRISEQGKRKCLTKWTMDNAISNFLAIAYNYYRKNIFTKNESIA